MKKFFLISILFISTLSFVPQPTFAADTTAPAEYTMLAPIPGLTTPGSKGTTNLTTFLPAVVKLMIGLATAFALLRIFQGGIQYLSTDAFSGKSAGKETITNAIVGLLLTIGAYTLLYTINPRLVSFNLAIQNSTIVGEKYTGVNVIGPDTGEEQPGPVKKGESLGNVWPSDQKERANFNSPTQLISINKQNCAYVGAENCTSLSGISESILTGLRKIKTACNCVVVVTGGTEYWLHGNRSTELEGNKTAHRPGGTVVDISLKTPVTDFLRKLPVSTRTGCSPGTERYEYAGGLYVNEEISTNDPHWHVCFN